MSYTRVNWVDGAGGGTPMDAANLNIMDAGIATLDTGKVSKAGDTLTGSLKSTPTLGGAAKTLYEWQATDAGNKDYVWRMNSDFSLELVNVTDSFSLLKITSAGVLTALGNTIWTSGNDGSGSGLDADTLDGLNSSAFAQVAAGVLAETAFNATGTYAVGGGNYAYNGGAVRFDGGQFKTTGSGTLFLQSFILGSGNFISAISFFSGTGSGTFSHGLGITPVWVGLTDNTSGSTMTVGAASYGSSTVAITTGASHAWKGIAIG